MEANDRKKSIVINKKAYRLVYIDSYKYAVKHTLGTDDRTKTKFYSVSMVTTGSDGKPKFYPSDSVLAINTELNVEFVADDIASASAKISKILKINMAIRKQRYL